MATLTSRNLAQSTAITPTTLIHIVTTGDTTQSSSGSSYKAELQQLYSIFGSGSFSGGSGNCITDLYVTNVHSCSPLYINPLDEGNIFIGSNSGFTYDVTNESILLKGSVNAQSDSSSLNSLISSANSTGLKGSIKYFSHTGRTVSLIFNPNTSGASQIYIGKIPGQDKSLELSYFGENYIRNSVPVNGNDFYQNKGVISIGNNNDGMVINISPTGNTGNLWFEQNGNSIIYIKGGPSPSDGSLGIMLNPDGTEEPTSNLQIGGTGTTGTFKLIDGNQQDGYVLTSDASGNASWQQQTGYQYYSAVTVSSAQTLTLFSSPVEILPAPGANKYYDFKVYFEYTYNSSPYTSNTIYLVDNTSKRVTKEFYIEGSDNAILVSNMDTQQNLSTVNSNLSLTTTVSDPTVGDGSLKIKIYYNIVNFG